MTDAQGGLLAIGIMNIIGACAIFYFAYGAGKMKGRREVFHLFRDHWLSLRPETPADVFEFIDKFTDDFIRLVKK